VSEKARRRRPTKRMGKSKIAFPVKKSNYKSRKHRFPRVKTPKSLCVGRGASLYYRPFGKQKTDNI
jgi:hypothetical protein